jgi:RHS repeat-associated protein
MEVDGEDQPIRSYAWGLDLSGSEQGAGGVGGLCFATEHATNVTYHASFDYNGNLTSLRNPVGGTGARYEYGPFGESLTARDALAGTNPFRFSTKYTDAETGLVYYGYRYYNASLGRWLNRDPIEEDDLVNLFGFTGNSAVSSSDTLGLWTRDDWTGLVGPYSGTATSECDDTLESLAIRITGSSQAVSKLKAGKYGTTTKLPAGVVVDIAPILEELERILRDNIVAASGKYQVAFSTPHGRAAALDTPVRDNVCPVNGNWDRQKILSYYYGQNTVIGKDAAGNPIYKNWADCNLISRGIYAKGLIDTVGAGAFDKAFVNLGGVVRHIGERSGDVADVKLGDRVHFLNSEKYTEWARRNLEWQGEYAIAVSVGGMSGPRFVGGGIDNQFDVTEITRLLLDATNRLPGRGNNPAATTIQGTQNKISFFNMSKIGMTMFDKNK